MIARIYATFDATTGPLLAVTQGNLLLQTAVTCDNARMARSTASATEPRYAQFLIHSPDGTKPALTSKAMMIGICTIAANINAYAGSDAFAYAYSPGDGKLYCNGASVATGTTSAYGDVISVVVDPQAKQLTVKNGNSTVIEYTLPSVESWYFAATISGVPGAMALQAYTGAAPMPYPIPALDGWWSPRVTIEPIYLGTEPYISLPADALAHQKFNGDIDRQSPVSIARGVKFWMWGASMPPALVDGTLIQMDILDPHRIYDALLTEDVRDLPVTFSRVTQGDSLDGAEQVYSALIDHVEPLTDQTKRIYLKGKLALAQSQLRRPVFPPTADPGVAGKLRPMSLGVCGPYAPELNNADAIQYACADSPLSMFGEVRVQGVPQVYGGAFAVTADGEGIQFNVAPVGAVTVRSTDFGGAFNQGASDALGGEGNFTSASAQSGGTPNRTGQPVGWNGDGGYAGQDPKTSVFILSGSSPNKVVTQTNVADAVYTLKDTSAFRILKGRSYAYSITCTAVPSYGDGSDPVTGQPKYANPATLAIGWLPNDGSHQNIAFFNYTKFGIPTATTYTGVFTNTTGADQPFVLGFLCNDRIAPGGGYLAISKIVLNLLPPIGQQSALPGPGLDAMLKALLVQRGPYGADEYDSTGALAIDAATGYVYGLHFSSAETPTVQVAYRPVLDSATADVFEDRSGDIQTIQLFAPEKYTGTLAGSLTVTDFASPLLSYEDLAENLTTRISGGKNYAPSTDADFQNVDVTQVPLAERKALEQPYAWTATGGGQLSPRYAAANTANPLGSCLDVQAHGQAEADRITGELYDVPRNFHVVDVYTPIGREIEIGEVRNVTYPTGVLDAGQNLLVVGVNEKPSEGISTVVFWGL